jgi:hypothetical protein
MKLAYWQALLAPWFAPVATATFLGWAVFDSLDERTGFIIAIIVAGATFLAFEFTGASAINSTIRSFDRKHWTKFILGAAMSIAYVVAGIAAVIELGHAKFLAWLFLLPPAAYLSYAIYFSFEEEHQHEAVKAQQQIEIIEAHKRLTNAQTRKAKAEGALATSGTTSVAVPATSGSSANLNGSSSGTSAQLPEWMSAVPETKAEFLKMLHEAVQKGLVDENTELNAAAIAPHTGKSARAVQNWTKEGREIVQATGRKMIINNPNSK